MNRSFTTLIFFVLSVVTGMSQGLRNYTQPIDTAFTDLKPRTRYFVETGAGFGSLGKNSKFNETFTRAGVSFSPVKKLNITTIVGVGSQTYNFNSANSESNFSKRFDSKSQNVWIGGEYELSKKVTIQASFFYQKSIFDPNGLNPRATDFNQAGGTFDIKYKINPNFEINGGIRVIQGTYPSLYDSFYDLDRGINHRGFLYPW
jgi:hypothetical protein